MITFTGTSFPASSNFTAKAYFKSAEAVVTGWSATSATATFTNGISATVTGETAVPRIEFTRTSDRVVLVTYSTGVSLTNSITVAPSDSTSGITSSFAGGVDYTITKAGIY